MKAIKLFSGILAGATLFTFATPSVLADEIANSSGTTTLEIVDFIIDENGLPSEPGEFVLDEVPSIDFGEILLSEANAGKEVTGTYTNDGKLSGIDSRPTSESRADALALIEAYQGDVDTDELEDAWTNAAVTSAWSLSAVANNLTGAASSLTIGGEEILESAATINGQEYQAGSFEIELGAAELTLAQNNLSSGTYDGTITYTIANVE